MSSSGSEGQRPDGEITVLRDAYGVPHIFADTEAGALYGFGYAQASDRPEAILRHVKQARGELAELDGPGALEDDIGVRAFTLRERAEAGYPALPLEVRTGVEAFCAGINRRFAERPDTLPTGGFTVTPTDIATFALFVNLAFALDTMEERSAGETPGSNAFALAAARTAAGQGSLVLLDPHLRLGGWMRWYEGHLCGGGMNVHGITFAGLPYIVMGHNGRVAWANTVNNPDLSDLYEERITAHTGQSPAYEYDGERRELAARTFTFRVRGAGDITRTIPYTHHGPVLLTEGDRAFAVKKAGVGDLGILTQARAQGLAANIDDYRAALALRHVVMFNHLFGDATGRIGFVSGGQVPRRPAGYNFRSPVPGWTSATEWGDTLPFAELPQATDPPGGWLQSANDGPTRCGAGDTLLPFAEPRAYPEWLAPHVLTRRGERLRDLLDNTRTFTPEQAMKTATDCTDLCALEELPGLLAAARSAADPALADPIRVLEAWDGTLTADSRGAALFQLWLMQPGVADHISTYGFLTPQDSERPPLGGAAPNAAVCALAQAAATLRAAGLPLDSPWGLLHRHRRGKIDLPMDGGMDSLVPNGGYPDASGRIYATFGSSFRMLVELGADSSPRAWSCAPYGNSDDPASPHYTDQMPLATTCRFRAVPFTRPDVEAEATTSEEL